MAQQVVKRLGHGAKVLSRDEYLSKMREVLKPMVQVSAMYNSLVGGIVRDPELMSMPVHDHAIVRGHAVFDTCTVARGRLFRAAPHLDRHISSALRARIPLPFGGEPEECKAHMLQAIAQTVVASGLQDATVRYYTTAGPGNFGVQPDGCTPAFYVVVMSRGADVAEAFESTREYTVDIPLKPELLATTKTNNYLLNVLTAMASADRGGTMGILVDGDGNIAESCISNCVFVTPDRRLVTPTFDKILAGTTVRKVLQVGQRLVEEGLLAGVSQEVIPLEKARSCIEMMLTGGDVHIKPVTHWDDQPVGDGVVGEVTKRIIRMLNDEMDNGTDDHHELVYSAC